MTDRASLGEILRKTRAADPAKGIAPAHLLTAFTAQRIAEVVGAQLDHAVGNKTASAYDRAQRLELRRKLRQRYESELLAARDGGQVVPLRTSGATR